MPRSKATEPPLILRLKEISASLRRIAKTDRMVQRGSKGDKQIHFFYEGAIQAGTMAARLIDEAISNHALSFSPGSRADRKPRSAPFSLRKKGARS